MKELNHLIKVLDPLEIRGDEYKVISAIQYDSRKCREDSLFAAIRGYVHDGHKFIGSAIENGAAAIICEEIPETNGREDIAYIKVEDSRLALAKLSHVWYNYPTKKMKVIGITGTNGKTTVTFILKSIFEAAEEKTGLIGTTGIYFGDQKLQATHTTPESLDLCEILDKMVKDGIATVIIEVSSHALHQKRSDGIEFDAAIFTNITRDHLDYHNDFNHYAASKKHLFDILKMSSLAVVNSDDKMAEYMLSESPSKIKSSCGRNETADFQITNVNFGIDKTGFTLNYALPGKDKKTNIYLENKLIGNFNVDNSAIAAACALALWVEEDAVKKGIWETAGAPGRMHRIPLNNGAVGIVDYAHTPDALEKALQACREFLDLSGHKDKRLICVFGCGGDRDKGKRPLMGEISARIADISVVTSDNPRTEDPERIIDDIIDGIPEKNRQIIIRINSRLDAIAKAVEISLQNDIILIAGKGHENYQVVETERLHFSDIEELEKFQ